MFMLLRAAALTATQSTSGSFLLLNMSNVTRIQTPTEGGEQRVCCCPGRQAGEGRGGSTKPVLQLWLKVVLLVCLSFLPAPSWFPNRLLIES